MQLQDTLLAGVSIMFGLIILGLAVSFLSGVFNSTTLVLATPGIGNYTGAQQSIQAIPTFASLAMMIAALVLILGPIGIVLWKGYKTVGGGKKGKGA